MRDFHRPVHRPGDIVEALSGQGDPAELSGLAHDTAAALLHRVRAAGDPTTVDRLIGYADQHGVDDMAELWATAPAVTLPGALWRLHLLRHTVVTSPDAAGYRFRRGLEVDSVNHAISGAPHAPTPEEVVALATRILRGAFEGDFALALERAAAFARVMAAGSHQLATGGRAPEEGRLAASYEALAGELTTCARAWRADALH